ncbi:MAG: GIY-YIG nuclease family protein [Psychromonas sp.]|nr:GIY-YIG nuclease family protein [Psychromonas sp.]
MAIGNRARNYSRPAPVNKAGNLYYVRLKTEYGIFYKIGFTASTSVMARLSFNGSSDGQYIDKVLLFIYCLDAFDVESKLHEILKAKSAFGKFSAKSDFLLSNNGQSELYIEDVLNLDPEYTDSQKDITRRKLAEKKIVVSGKTYKQAKLQLDIFEAISKPLFVVLVIGLTPIILPITIISCLVQGESIKSGLRDFLNRATGDKERKEREEHRIQLAIREELSRIGVTTRLKGN